MARGICASLAFAVSHGQAGQCHEEEADGERVEAGDVGEERSHEGRPRGVACVGRLAAGTTENVIPETAVMEGTLRTVAQKRTTGTAAAVL